ncbi:MAG: hypothetical protein ACPHJ3_13605, partial [Rubripirellula sp.]
RRDATSPHVLILSPIRSPLGAAPSCHAKPDPFPSTGQSIAVGLGIPLVVKLASVLEEEITSFHITASFQGAFRIEFRLESFRFSLDCHWL